MSFMLGNIIPALSEKHKYVLIAVQESIFQNKSEINLQLKLVNKNMFQSAYLENNLFPQVRN